MLGRRVRVLVDDLQEAGLHRLAFRADDLPAGAWFLRVTTPQATATRAVTLHKFGAGADRP